MKQNQLQWCLLAFIFGLISKLFVPTPVGFVAMLDMLTYVLGPIIMIKEFGRYERKVRLLFALAFLWLLGGIMSDLYRGTPGALILKQNMIIFNAITTLAVAFWILRHSPKAIAFFFAASAISGFISLYAFQNGAILFQAIRAGYDGGGSLEGFLAEKMRYPLYIGVVIMAIIMPLRIRGLIPWPVCIAGYFLAAMFVLLNGSARSTCLIYLANAFLVCMYVYWPKTLKSLFRYKFRALLYACAAALCANFLYHQAAKAGLLGEEGMKHYEQKQSGESTSFLDDRADLLVNWPFLWRHPILGAGSELIDRWGYVDDSPYVSHVDAAGRYVRRERFLGHSVLVGQWTACGAFGLIYWVFVLVLFISFLSDKVLVLGQYGPFCIASIVTLTWHILFSPYGGHRSDITFMTAFVTAMASPRFIEIAKISFWNWRLRK